MKTRLLSLLFIASQLHLFADTKSKNLVIHEWGTFTSLQDEAGNAIGGINTDDEPVPPFVHRLARLLLLSPSEVPPVYFQGAPRCHPDVTMRLETPVLYFHPPATQAGVQRLDVKVAFRGGWLTEYFPDAKVDAPGLPSGTFNFGPLKPETVGKLTWANLKVGGNSTGPATTEHVWTSPRAVKAASVTASGGESEKFLFYRGVGNLQAPLRIAREAGNLVVRSQVNSALAAKGPLKIPALWLTEIRPDGDVAFRKLPSVELSLDSHRVLSTLPANFQTSDFSTRNMNLLHASLREALMGQGLFADEADALLNTWELSYFKSVGLRLFFIVPRAWTDQCLPLEVSEPASIERVMVGRIELVTPAQRALLRQIASQPAAVIEQQSQQMRSDYYARVLSSALSGQINSGKKTLGSSGISIPPAYRAYLDLGRFHNALLLDEAKRRPSEGLTAFIKWYGLEGHQPPAAAVIN